MKRKEAKSVGPPTAGTGFRPCQDARTLVFSVKKTGGEPGRYLRKTGDSGVIPRPRGPNGVSEFPQSGDRTAVPSPGRLNVDG